MVWYGPAQRIGDRRMRLRPLDDLAERLWRCSFGGYLDAGPRLRRAGAGFGGCPVEKVRAEVFAELVSQAYTRSTGIEPRLHTVEPSAGRLFL